MRYSGARNPYGSSSLVLRTMMRYALERELYRGSTSAISIELPKGRDVGSEFCREFGVSRPTGYRWINRYKESGPEGLLNLSSKPHSCSHATPETIENAILALRGKYPSWGARKLKARLEQLDSSVEWPVASTFGNILQRAGLTSPKRKKRRTTPYSEPFSEVTAPNQLWCMDFKGYFATGDGTRCDPFTITDAHSRYLIRCQIVSRMDLSQVRAVCEAAMREMECLRGSERQWRAIRWHWLTRPVEALARMDEDGDHSRAHSAWAPSAERASRTNASNPQGGDN